VLHIFVGDRCITSPGLLVGLARHRESWLSMQATLQSCPHSVPHRDNHGSGCIFVVHYFTRPTGEVSGGVNGVSDGRSYLLAVGWTKLSRVPAIGSAVSRLLLLPSNGIREPPLILGNSIITGAVVPTSNAIGLHFYPRICRQTPGTNLAKRKKRTTLCVHGP
jgi:hypothetical protein